MHSEKNSLANDPLALAALYQAGLGSKWDTIAGAAGTMSSMGVKTTRYRLQLAVAVAALPTEVLSLFSQVGIVVWTGRMLLKASKEIGVSQLAHTASQIDPAGKSRSQLLSLLRGSAITTKNRRTYNAVKPLSLHKRYLEGVKLGAWSSMREAAEAMELSHSRLAEASEIAGLPSRLKSLLPMESVTFEIGQAIVDLVKLRGIDAICDAAVAADKSVARRSPKTLLARLTGINGAPFAVKVRRAKAKRGGIVVELHLDSSDPESETRLQMVVDLLNMQFAINSAATATSPAKPSQKQDPRAAIEPPAKAPCPLERLYVRQEFDGSSGTNRNLAQSEAGPGSDRAALEEWLSNYDNVTTRERYRNEAERVLLWALFCMGKPLSSLDADDADEYMNQFVANPTPASIWVMKGQRSRADQEWRPFRGPLSEGSRQRALSALKKCFADLVSSGYLLDNPFGQVNLDTNIRKMNILN